MFIKGVVISRLQHNDTMQHSVWGLLGSGAPNYHRGTARRTRSLHAAGILPQGQVNKAARMSPALLQATKAQGNGGKKESAAKAFRNKCFDM